MDKVNARRGEFLDEVVGDSIASGGKTDVNSKRDHAFGSLRGLLGSRERTALGVTGLLWVFDCELTQPKEPSYWP